MRTPISWLADFVDIDLDPEKLAEKLTLSGTKVDEIIAEGKDWAFEFEITPNRADLFSVYGLAREIAVLTHQELKELDTQLHYAQGYPKDKIKLTLLEKDLCLSYALGVFDNVTITSSPSKIVDRLQKSGLRAIDSIVDVTNYVTLETGIPSHAFDFDKIKNNQMRLRSAKKGETVTTLDNQNRPLPMGTIIIEDDEKLIDLAGLMGGKNSAIDKNTKKVALLVPIYNPVSIRRASLELGLRTEASGRFEKKLDPLAVKNTFYRIASLFFETSGARLSSEVTLFHQESSELKIIDITLTEIEKHLGISILGENLVNYLTPLGFLVKHLPQEGSDKFAVTVPSWRGDVSLKVDITEEVARLYGYNNFPKTLPAGDLPTHADSFTPDWERLTKETLVSSGVNEVYGYTLLSKKLITKAGFVPEKTVKILNPNSEDFVYLRPALLPTLLESVSLNLLNFKTVNLFEIGKVFYPAAKDLPNQSRQLSIVTTQNFATLKGFIINLAARLNLKLNFKKANQDWLDPSQGGSIFLGKTEVGWLGSVNKALLTNFDIPGEANSATLDFETIIKHASLDKDYQPLPKFPEVKEDLSIVVDEKITTEEILTLIQKAGKPLLRKVVPFDYFVSAKIGEGKKSIAFALSFGANKTLTNQEVAKIRGKITKTLEKELKAEIR